MKKAIPRRSQKAQPKIRTSGKEIKSKSANISGKRKATVIS